MKDYKSFIANNKERMVIEDHKAVNELIGNILEQTEGDDYSRMILRTLGLVSNNINESGADVLVAGLTFAVVTRKVKKFWESVIADWKKYQKSGSKISLAKLAAKAWLVSIILGKVVHEIKKAKDGKSPDLLDFAKIKSEMDDIGKTVHSS